MKQFAYLIAILVLAACGDDDSSMPQDAAPRDAATDSARPDGATTVDGEVIEDAAVVTDSGGDGSMSAPDAGDAAVCERENFEPLRGFYEPGRAVSVTRVPFREDPEQPTLEDLHCTDLDDAGFSPDEDAGNGAWLAREGCGRVLLESLGNWPRFLSFDAETGELIGRVAVDDVTNDIAGCETAQWIAGEVLASCPSDKLSVCYLAQRSR
jgi:hypothetical protein